MLKLFVPLFLVLLAMSCGKGKTDPSQLSESTRRSMYDAAVKQVRYSYPRERKVEIKDYDSSEFQISLISDTTYGTVGGPIQGENDKGSTQSGWFEVQVQLKDGKYIPVYPEETIIRLDGERIQLAK